LNAKLDLGDETEECHGLTTSASREKALSHRNGKKTANKQSACWRSPRKRQNKRCKTPDKLNAVRLFMDMNSAEFCTSLTLELSGARPFARPT